MFTAQKANRVLKIEEIKADEYVAMGYTVMTDDGTIIGAPITVESLKMQLAEKDKRIAELEAQLSKSSKSRTKADDTKADEIKKAD